MSWKRTELELQQALHHQYAMLCRSCEGFDNGEEWEAVRIATSVFVLVVDRGRQQKSISTQIGVREKLRFPCPDRDLNPRNLLSESILTQMRLSTSEDGHGADYVPVLNDCPVGYKYRGFTAWFEQEVIRDRNRRTLSRKNIVYHLRDKEGGSHFDPELSDEAFVSIAKHGGDGWVISDKNGERLIQPGSHLAAMRHIGWEVCEALRPYLKE